MTLPIRCVTLSTLICLVLTTAAFAEEGKELHDALKPVPRGGGWMKRHESMNARVKKGNVDLVSLAIRLRKDGRVEARTSGKNSTVHAMP